MNTAGHRTRCYALQLNDLFSKFGLSAQNGNRRLHVRCAKDSSGPRVQRSRSGEPCDNHRCCDAGPHRECPDEPRSRPFGIEEPQLDAEFFTREPVRRALAGYDFGYLFRAVRRHAGLTQQELGNLLELDQDHISRIERGERRLRDISIIARVASRLRIPPLLLGFDPGTVSVEWPDVGGTRAVDWVRRRDSSWIVAGIVLGVGADALDADRLDALLHTIRAAPTTARIGLADVEAIEQATAAVRHSDFSRGGGICRPMAVAKLRSVLALRHAACDFAVRGRLMVATADLGMVAAWTSYEPNATTMPAGYG